MWKKPGSRSGIRPLACTESALRQALRRSHYIDSPTNHVLSEGTQTLPRNGATPYQGRASSRPQRSMQKKEQIKKSRRRRRVFPQSDCGSTETVGQVERQTDDSFNWETPAFTRLPHSVSQPAAIRALRRAAYYSITRCPTARASEVGPREPRPDGIPSSLLKLNGKTFPLIVLFVDYRGPGRRVLASWIIQKARCALPRLNSHILQAFPSVW